MANGKWLKSYCHTAEKKGKWKIAVDFTIYHLLFTGFNNLTMKHFSLSRLALRGNLLYTQKCPLFGGSPLA